MWGARGVPPLGAYMEVPDIDRHLDTIEQEAVALGLVAAFERRAELPDGGEVVLVQYEGTDALGRARHAVRAVTDFGVILAVGPPKSEDRSGRADIEFLDSLLDVNAAAEDAPGAFRSLSDLNGDGQLDIALRSARGELSIWRVGSRGAVELTARMEVVPTRAEDVDGDGILELWGEVPQPSDAQLEPRLLDVAVFNGEAYRNDHPTATAFHRDAAERREAALASETEEARLARWLERAWHDILGGGNREKALTRLSKARPPKRLDQEFFDWARRVARIGQ